MDWLFCDLVEGSAGKGLEVLFPGFSKDECITVISPHDDDALLGAGYLIQAALDSGAQVRVLVICDGSAGYSRVEDKKGIVERRKSESVEAYQLLGVAAEDLHWLDVPDFSAIHYLGWKLPTGETGLFGKITPLLRDWKTTRLLIPNGHREHIDHTGAYLAGVFFGPQSGDAVIADWGQAPPVRSALVYSVWADFPPAPERALRADRAVVAVPGAEQKVIDALGRFESQAAVISGLVETRKQRNRGDRWIELYMTIDPRPPLSYEAYWDEIDGLI